MSEIVSEGELLANLARILSTSANETILSFPMIESKVHSLMPTEKVLFTTTVEMDQRCQ